MKTIILINIVNPSRVSHFETLAKYDHHVTLIMKKPTWEAKYFDKVIDIDTENTRDVLSAVNRLSEEMDIAGVVTFVEHAVPLASQIAEYLMLPFISLEVAIVSRNKYLMRKKFMTYKLNSSKFDLANTIGKAKKVCNEIGYPVVVKPLIGGGSLSVMRINSEEELVANFNHLKSKSFKEFEYDPLFEMTTKEFGDSMLIEEYLEGAEVSVESLVVNGQTHILGIHDKNIPMNGPYFEERYFTTPTRHSKEIEEKIKISTKMANTALGINMGATHSEFRITEKGEVFILEVGSRIGGGPVYQSILNSTGIDMVKLIVEQSIGKEIEVEQLTPTVSNKVGFQHFFPAEEGKINNIIGKEKYVLNKDIVEFLMYVKEGDEVKLPPNSIALGHVTITGTSFSEIDQKITEIEQDMEITIV